MGLADPHDPRLFTHFAKLNADGTVAAIVEVADTYVTSAPPSADGQLYVDVTELRQQWIDPLTVKVSADVIAAVRKRQQADPTDTAQHDLAAAFRTAALKGVGFVAQETKAHGGSE